MKKVAIIPLRKGSKGIPGKNKKKMLGRPLFSWVLGAAIFSDLDEVYVFTDDEEILRYIQKEYHWTTKVKGLLRDDANANDTASTESAMLEFAEKIDERLLASYKRIRNNSGNGLAVVGLERGAPKGSFFTIPPQKQMEIAQRKKIIIDEHSGKILVDDELVMEENEKMASIIKF